jgi:starch phosphorylase
MYPYKFRNVTNGIAHRRWLCYANPKLAELLDECIGTGYRRDSSELARFSEFSDDSSVLERIGEIKRENKAAFAKYFMCRTGKSLNIDSVFDVHIKRLHEYKRQLLNALNIIGLYLDVKEGRGDDIPAQTFIFGAKAAPGYHMAKSIIKLIYFIGKEIESDKSCRKDLPCILLRTITSVLPRHSYPPLR